MYAIVKTGGKQYRVSQGEHLLVERLPVDDGATVDLQPLLYVDGADVVDGDDIAKVTVQARVNFTLLGIFVHGDPVEVQASATAVPREGP